MADYLVTDKDLTLIADAIRTKSGTSEPMTWPNGYKEAIEAINAKSNLRVDTGTFTLAEDTQAPAVIHNLGVIPDLVIVEATDHDNTAYSILGFMAVRPELLSTTAFGGLIFVNNSAGTESGAVTTLGGANAFKHGLSDTGFVCAYNNANYKYRAGWTYQWKVFASIQSGGGAKEPYTEETYDANGDLIEANLVGYTAIRPYVFYNCTTLTLTSLPNDITSIGDYAFYNCSKLALTSLPSGLISIGNNAFQSCTKLALTSLPSGVTSIGNGAFYNCSKLALTSLPSGVTSIGGSTFYKCAGLASITFQGKPNSISANAFYGCTNLKTINVPWASGEVANAPWGATNATINYNYTG